MNRTIELIVSPQGETKLETKGFAGSSCRQATQFLEQALGKVANEQLTSEFYAQISSPQQVQQGGST